MTTGWLCPKCGSGVAPSCERCPCVVTPQAGERITPLHEWLDTCPVQYPPATWIGPRYPGEFTKPPDQFGQAVRAGQLAFGRTGLSSLSMAEELQRRVSDKDQSNSRSNH